MLTKSGREMQPFPHSLKENAISNLRLLLQMVAFQITMAVITRTLVAATKQIGLEVNAHKTKYMTVSRDQNAGRIHSMKTDNSSIERVEEFKYLGTTLTNQNSI